MGLVAVTLLLLPVYPLMRRGVETLWFAAVLRLAGLRVRVHGQPASRGPVLYAANHVSYLDILVLGRLLDARFIAKSDVRSWPGIGFLAKLARTCFIERVAARAATQNGELATVLERGENLILFAEGTSSDGRQVLPFKSSLFGVVERVEGLRVQPVALDYTHLNGRPVADAAARDVLAWYGEMTLMPHLWTFLGQRGAEVTVRFPPVQAWPGPASRKTVAASAENAVRLALHPPAITP